MNHMSVDWITLVVINVNPNFRRSDRRESSAKAILNCRIDCDGNIEILRSRRRLGEQLSAWQEGILLQHSVFIPHTHFFPECLKGKRQCELAAQRVAVRTNVTQDGETLMVA